MVAALGKRMFSKCVAPGLQMHPAAGTLMQNTSHKNVPHRSGGLISPDCLAPPAPPHPSKEELVRCHSQIANDTVSERLRRWTRNPLGSARRGSNPLGVVFCAMRVSRIVAKASAHELHEYRRFAWRGRTASRASPPYLTWAVGTSYRVMRCAGSTSWHSQQVSDAAGGPHLRGLSCNHHHHHNHQRGDVT